MPPSLYVEVSKKAGTLVTAQTARVALDVAALFVWVLVVLQISPHPDSRSLMWLCRSSLPRFSVTVCCCLVLHEGKEGKLSEPETARFHRNLEEERPAGEFTSLLFSRTSREDLRLDGYLEYPHATNSLYIYKHPCFLLESNPGPMVQQSESLTTIPDG
ncbi:hypothetical protein TNCV_4501251 [Trichonephila clavipes]|nr:hypothetical protein TNCV_4501251 [Trichonephila clavipes]